MDSNGENVESCCFHHIRLGHPKGDTFRCPDCDLCWAWSAEDDSWWPDTRAAHPGRTPEAERALGEQILHYADDETLREHGIDPAQTGRTEEHR